MPIYLDTNAFIAAVEGSDDSQANRALRALFALSESKDGVLVTSELALAELLVKPLQDESTALAETYLDLVSTKAGLDVVPIDRGILIQAAHVRKDDPSIRLPDAIHLATADRMSCSIILTNDKQLAAKRPRLCRPITEDAIRSLMKDIS